MKPYCENQRPFVYAMFSDKDRGQAISVMEKISESGVSFWFPEQFSKKEIRRIEAAFSCILFITNNSAKDENIWRIVDSAVKYNKKILCIYLEQTVLSPGQKLRMGSTQSLNIDSFPDEQGFLEKLKSAEVFSDMKITDAQKRFARRRALASVFIPVTAAVVIFFAVVVPLLIIPASVPVNGALSKLGFGNLSLEELAMIKELNVIGTQTYDQWYTAYYTDTQNEIHVVELKITIPKGDISNISDLALLTNAREISFEANQVSDITPLYKIKSLERLTLNCNPIKYIEGIEALQNLKEINLTDTEVSDISSLFKIPVMESIFFDNTPVSSIEGIEKLKRLTRLGIGQSGLNDISPLNGIDFSFINETDGFYFQAKNALVKDFSPLTGIPKFEEVFLTLEQFNINDILPYINNKQVTRLHLAGSDIKNISLLSSIEGIRLLDLYGSYQLTSI